MKGYITIALLFFLATLTVAENPGFIAGLRLPIVNKIKAQYFDYLMEQFKEIHIGDIKKGDLKITGINVEVVNDNHDNVQIGFNEEKNALAVTVTNTKIKVHVNWKYSVLILKVSGVGDIKGTISHVGMNLGFETQEKSGRIVPAVNIQDFDLGFDKGSFNFHFNCGACPGKVTDLILNAFKGPLLDEVKKQARGVVNGKVVGTVNQALQQGYPLAAELSDELSISLATTGPVVIKSDYLSAPLDGTIFLTNEGYNRPVDAPEIPVESPENPGEILLFVSKYMYQTLQKSINKTPVDFETSVMGFDVKIEVDGTQNPLEVDTRDGQFYIAGGAKVSIPGLFTTVEVAASSSLDLFFQGGDATNMVYIDPEINEKSLELSKFKLTVFGFPIDLSVFSGFANTIISFIISKVVFPQIAVPKTEALPLTATTALINFFETYTEAGIAFNFGLDH